MPGYLRKVKKGQKFKPDAFHHNETVDAINLIKKSNRRFGGGPTSTGGPRTAKGTIVYGVNTTGEPLEAWTVVGLDGVTFPSTGPDDTATADKLAANVCFDVIKPTDDSTGLFGIVLDGCGKSKDSVARILIDGVCAALVKCETGDEAYADVENGSFHLKAGSSGAAQILWIEEEGEPDTARLAVVRIGNPSAPGIKYGKATTAATSASSLVLTPCDIAGVVTGEPNITCSVVSPTGTTQTGISIAVGQVLRYIEDTGGSTPTGQLLPIKTDFTFTSPAVGTISRQVYQMINNTTAGWDFPRGHL